MNNETIYILRQKEHPKSLSPVDVFRVFSDVAAMTHCVMDERDVVYKLLSSEVDLASSTSLIDYCLARDEDNYQRYLIGDLVCKTEKLQ